MAPPVVFASSSMITFISSDSFAAAERPGTSFSSLAVWPVWASAIAFETVSTSFPEAAEMSSAAFMTFCALATSPVAVTSVSSAGRSSSSATPVAREMPVIQSSVALTCGLGGARRPLQDAGEVLLGGGVLHRRLGGADRGDSRSRRARPPRGARPS